MLTNSRSVWEPGVHVGRSRVRISEGELPEPREQPQGSIEGSGWT